MPSERKQLNVRLSDHAWELLDQLIATTGLSQADLVTQGLRLLAKREGVTVEAPKERKGK